MSWCRCAEISRINHDIDTLNSVRTRLRSMIDRDSTKSSELSQLSEDVMSTFQPASVSRMATGIRNMNREVASANSALLKTVSAEIGSLTQRRTRLTNLDRAHHQAMNSRT